MSVVEQSDALHRRVRGFAEGSDSAGFERLALDIARFQARHSEGFRRLCDARGASLDDLDGIPAVPCDAFRVARVAIHPRSMDTERFETSGTTSRSAGVHAFRTTATYRRLALLGGRRALLARDGARVTVVCLAPPPSRSSLGFMMQVFAGEWDGRCLDRAGSADPGAADPRRWAARADRVDVASVTRAAELARERGEPLLVLATAFALAALVEAVAERGIAAPVGSVVMLTGGFKGRRHDVSEPELRRRVGAALGIERSHMVGEYGMTELTSQLYEGTLGTPRGDDEPPVYLPPRWLRVDAVDPEALRPVPEGEAGLARFVDLGNVDSAVAVVAQDLVRRRGDGVELLGRRSGAPARGCSLAVEALLDGDP